MSGRERLLAEIEARRRQQARKPVDILQADLSCAPDDAGYNPYDNPGRAKPFQIDRNPTSGRRAAKRRR